VSATLRCGNFGLNGRVLVSSLLFSGLA